ncbi:hypothetical protein BH10BAC1_BH10BAC1_20580 [soil metagenome]
MLLINKYKRRLKSKRTIIIACLLFTCNLFGQNNLVPNGSFENYSSCPTGIFGQINRATPWFQPNYPYAGSGGSSD